MRSLLADKGRQVCTHEHRLASQRCSTPAKIPAWCLVAVLSDEASRTRAPARWKALLGAIQA